MTTIGGQFIYEKEMNMNYTIEFYRFMFAVSFVIIHGLMVIPIGYQKGFPLFVSVLDIIV